jgi:raffinose/stachyose/melibiose transport system substrate-binding protein
MFAPLPRRRFLQLSTMTVGAAALAACGAGGSGSPGSGDIEFWAAFATKDSENYFRTNFVDAYNKSATGADALKVKMTVKQVETLERLVQTAVAAGEGPDLIETSGPAQTLRYSNNGNLLPLDAYIDKFGWREKMLPWALEAGQVNGKLYSLPGNFETLSIYFNPATLDEHGWKPPTTLAEFEGICADAKAKGLVPVGAGNADWKAATEWHVTWVWNAFAGPQAIYEALNGDRKWSDPVFVDAIALLKSWFDKGWYGGSTDAYFTNQFTTMYQQLAAGKVALIPNGSWTFTEITPFFGDEAGNNATWDWAPLPSLRAGVAAGVQPLSIGDSTSLNKATKHPDQAAAVLDFFLAEPKRQLARLASTGVAPTAMHFSDSEFPADTDPRIKRQYIQLSAGKDIGYTTWTFWPSKSDTYIYEEMEKVLVGKVSPKEYCAGLDTLFTEELAAGSRPPVPSPSGP